jgi:cephalosporin hydroxylase
MGSAERHQAFFQDLVAKTENFSHITWLGRPVWQNILDLWTIQETISQLRPSLLIETGTHQGGSALFYAHLFDLMGDGRVISIDLQRPEDLRHPRIRWVTGSSIDPGIVAEAGAEASASVGPVMVILDSDHAQAHVAAELEAYAPMVTPGSWLLVQDGVLDTLPMFSMWKPGPLPAIDDFLARHAEFELDGERCERFLITHHPRGWLRRRN